MIERADFDLGWPPLVESSVEASMERNLDANNLFKTVDEYLEDNKSEETKKATEKAVKLFNTVMKQFHEKTKTPFKPIAEMEIDELLEELSRQHDWWCT